MAAKRSLVVEHAQRRLDRALLRDLDGATPIGATESPDQRDGLGRRERQIESRNAIEAVPLCRDQRLAVGSEAGVKPFEHRPFDRRVLSHVEIAGARPPRALRLDTAEIVLRLARVIVGVSGRVPGSDHDNLHQEVVH